MTPTNKKAKGAGTIFLPLGSLRKDKRVQRELDERWVAYLLENFDPDLVGVIEVSERADGTFVIIDGQHRVEAARRLFKDDAQMIECKVYREKSVQQEAALFIGHNTKRGMTRAQLFQKSVIAGNATSVAINRIINEAGFKVSNYVGDGLLTAVGAAQSVYFGFQPGGGRVGVDLPNKFPGLLRDTLKFVSQAWGNSKDAVHTSMLLGVGLFLMKRGRAAQVAELLHKAAQYPAGPLGILSRARGLMAIQGGTIGANVADVLIDIYNKGRRTGRLEPIRKGE